MNGRERIKALIKGKETDRIPISFWRHFPIMDRDQKFLAQNIIHFQNTYDLDFIKMMPNGLYSAADFGIKIAYSTDLRKTDEVKRYGIKKPEDWERLEQSHPENGVFFRQLESLALVFEAVGKSVPVVETVFSPLTTAEKIAGANLIPHLREHPEKVLAGLEFLTEVTINFLRRCLDIGIDGIFFATKCATSQMMTCEEYNRFGRPYDLKVLETARSLWFNILHIHGQNTFDLFDYPVQALNYHHRSSDKSQKNGRSVFPGVLIGGIDETDTLVNGPENRIRKEIKKTISQKNGHRLILGPGCVLSPLTPNKFLQAARQAVAP